MSQENLCQDLVTAIRRAAGGDVEAFEDLYDRTSVWLLARVRRITGEMLAEDVLTEVYLQIWRDLATFDPARGNPLSWMASIARSRALDLLRREHARPSGHSDPIQDHLTFSEMAHDDGPEQQVSHRQQCLALKRTIGRLLSTKERMVIGLAFYRECTHTEIAAMTGLPLGTVKTLLHRSQQKLRDELIPALPARAVHAQA